LTTAANAEDQNEKKRTLAHWEVKLMFKVEIEFDVEVEIDVKSSTF